MNVTLFGLIMLVGMVSQTPANEITSTPIATPHLVDSGSTDNPVPFGESIAVGDYDVHVAEVTPDALDIVMDENNLSPPPDTDAQFVMVRVQVTYNGSDKGDPFRDLNFRVAAKSGAEYSRFDPYGCGKIPDQQLEAGTLEPGKDAEFNVCWAVDPADAGSLVLIAEYVGGDQTELVWMKLTN